MKPENPSRPESQPERKPSTDTRTSSSSTSGSTRSSAYDDKSWYTDMTDQAEADGLAFGLGIGTPDTRHDPAHLAEVREEIRRAGIASMGQKWMDEHPEWLDDQVRQYEEF